MGNEVSQLEATFSCSKSMAHQSELGKLSFRPSPFSNDFVLLTEVTSAFALIYPNFVGVAGIPLRNDISECFCDLDRG